MNIQRPPILSNKDFLDQILGHFSEYNEIHSNKERIINQNLKVSSEENQYIGERSFYNLREKIYNITGIRNGVLSNLLNSEFDNPVILRIIYCIINIILEQDINSWIEDLQLVGAGISGEVYEATIKGGSKSDIIIKVQNNLEDLTMTHELFVGLFGTNRLRELGILNFSYVYGGFNCTHTLRVPNQKQPYNWCSTKGGVKYIIYERVPGPTLEKELPNCSPDQFTNYLVQLVFALYEANVQINYTHYDLHPGNIILRPLSKDMQIYYGQLFITTSSIATIIDYGLNFFTFDGRNWGPYFGETDIASNTRPFAVYDIFKLLISSYKLANPVLRLTIALYLKFFTDLEPERLLSVKEGTIWLPRYYERYSLKDFFDFLISNFAPEINFISSIPKGLVLGCNFKTCLGEKILKDRILDSYKLPSNPVDFYNLAILLERKNPQRYKYLLEDYNHVGGSDVLIAQHDSYLQEINMILNFPIIKIENDPTNQFVLDSYLKYLINLSNLIDSYNKLFMTEITMEYFNKVFSTKFSDFISPSIRDIIRNRLNDLKRDYSLLEEYKNQMAVAVIAKLVFWYLQINF